MVHGPDPNRNFETDPEVSAEEQRRGSDIGDTRTTRLGLSSWGIAILALVLVVAVLIFTR
jgi:hypothetical protein